MTSARTPAGTPAGGQFAPGRQADTGVTLDADIDAVVVDDAHLAVFAGLRKRHRAVGKAERDYERSRAPPGGYAEIVHKRWPQAHAVAMGPSPDDPDHLVATGLYSSAGDDRLPISDAELHTFNFDNDDAFTLSRSLCRPPLGSAYLAGGSNLPGTTFDVDKARGLLITEQEIHDGVTGQTLYHE